MPFWPKTPIPPLAVGPPAQAGFLSSKPECLFLRNHDKLGPLPLPNGDSIEPRDSSSELAAYGDPQPPWTLNTRTSTAFSLLGPFFHCPPEIQKSRGRPSRTRSFACHERRAYPRTNRATAKHPMKVMRDVPILTLSGLAGLLVGMALYRFHVPFLILVGISIAPIIVWAAYETSKMFD